MVVSVGKVERMSLVVVSFTKAGFSKNCGTETTNCLITGVAGVTSRFSSSILHDGIRHAAATQTTERHLDTIFIKFFFNLKRVIITH